MTKLVEKIDGVKVDDSCNHLTCIVCKTDLCAKCGPMNRCTCQSFDRDEVDRNQARIDGGVTSDDRTAEDIAEAMHTMVLNDAD